MVNCVLQEFGCSKWDLLFSWMIAASNKASMDGGGWLYLKGKKNNIHLLMEREQDRKEGNVYVRKKEKELVNSRGRGGGQSKKE